MHAGSCTGGTGRDLTDRPRISKFPRSVRVQQVGMDPAIRGSPAALCAPGATVAQPASVPGAGGLAPLDPPPLDGRTAVHDDLQSCIVGDPRGLPVDHTELQPHHPGACRDSLARVRYAQLGASEDIDHLERTGRGDRLRDRPERRNTQEIADVRVDRHALEALVDQIAEDRVRRPAPVPGRADDSDAPSRPEDAFDPTVVEDRDGSAPLLEVEEGCGPVAFLPRQVAASRSYGWPSAAGGMLRPTTPARMMIVTR